MARIIKIIPVPETTRKKYECINFDNLEYIPVTFSELENISFQLKSHTGNMITFFDDGNSEVFINLVFSKKKESNKNLE